MVTPDDVVSLYLHLDQQGIKVWLTGGWGIDALLAEDTRPHKDLDVFVLVEDVVRLNELLAQDGYEFKEIWSENLSTIDSRGNTINTAYVLRDLYGRELDVHAFRFDQQGNGIPAWKANEGFILSPQDLSGQGSVNGVGVRCQSAENQMVCHTGYRLPDYQWGDLARLRARFGVDYPPAVLDQLAGGL